MIPRAWLRGGRRSTQDRPELIPCKCLKCDGKELVSRRTSYRHVDKFGPRITSADAMMEDDKAVTKETLRTIDAGAKADVVTEMEGAADPPPGVRVCARAGGIIYAVYQVRMHRGCTWTIELTGCTCTAHAPVMGT